jgi:hypothetical protein
MADDGLVIRGIDWRQTFSFTHIFRSFRIAVHPTKLALGLALLLTIYFSGRILDSLWPARARALPGEVAEYQLILNGEDKTTLADWRQQQRDAMDDAYAQQLVDYKIVTQDKGESDDAFHSRTLDSARNADYLDDVHTHIENDRDDAVGDAGKKFAKDPHAQDAAVQDAYAAARYEWIEAQNIKGQGLFQAIFQYEIYNVNHLVFDGVLRNNWLGTDGVKDSLYNFFAVGPIWLIWNHTVFFIIFAVIFLVAWALFGGAISRIAAVHVARDEKISIRQAMNFAFGKILSFASAPVIPLVIVIVIGLIIAAASLIGNIPFLGAIVVGGLFIVALLAGAVMTLVLLGTAGGFNLMYPTIAVEGSDSFDAISRSFSYVYARPWRLLFYSVVALVYGAATYLFVHMFIWLTLVLTHKFVGMGIFLSAQNRADLFPTMWAGPLDVGRLTYSPDYAALGVGAKIGAFLLYCWVMLLVSFLGAFAISLYFSTNTIVYYLMRNEVDSTEMDDVFLEQSEEELEPTLVSATVTVTTEGSPVATADPPPAAPSA